MGSQEESLAMRLFRSVGLESVAWSFRRLYCPVDRGALVLEVGSGGNPYARANILLDAYEETKERHWVPLKIDRPMAIGFVEKLPFKDRAFDFVIASHVLEHSSDPSAFLAELQRVAKAGYIEVPDAFMERINPYTDHRLEITCRDEKLIIRKKTSQIVEPDTVELYEDRVKPFLTRELIPKRPFAFHVRYYWDNNIDFDVVNPEADASWVVEDKDDRSAVSVLGFKARLQGVILDKMRSLLSQRRRNEKLNILDMLQCPNCQSESLSSVESGVVCSGCGVIYPVRQGIPIMYPNEYQP